MEKLDSLRMKAKADILALMKKKGCMYVNLIDHEINIYENNDTADVKNYKQCLVKGVYRSDNGECLEFDAEGASFWYFNPVVWLEIHDAVVREISNLIDVN